jgi:ABC-type glycerol-3-phosphate transport system substrate-binding protein
MKITRSLVAALFIAMATAACSSSPTAPTSGDPVSNYIPLLGSGVGG